MIRRTGRAALAAAVVILAAASSGSADGSVGAAASHDATNPALYFAPQKAANVTAAAQYSHDTFPVGSKSVKVLIVSTPEARPQSNREQIDTVMREVAALFSKVSGGKMTMSHTVEEKSVATIACREQVTKDIDFKTVDHIVEYVPPTAATCGFAGVGTLGGEWVQVTGDSFTTRVVAHELGHNLGLNHAKSVLCPDMVTAWTLCQGKEYGDEFELMGGGTTMIGPVGRTALDWHDPTVIKVNVQGEVDLPESPAALVLTDPAGGGEYWFEYIRQSTVTAMASDQILVRRVAVEEYGRSSGSSLFDRGRPKTYDLAKKSWIIDTGFRVGEMFVDPTGQVKVEVLSTDVAARLRVTAPPRPAAPAWSLIYTRYTSSRGSIDIKWPTTLHHTQSLDITVWKVDGTSTTIRRRPTWSSLDLKSIKSIAAVTVTPREPDGTGQTSSIVFRKNPNVPPAANATAVANGVRITVADPTRHNRMRVTCGHGAMREFTDLTRPITVRGTGIANDCLARLQSLSNGVVTSESAILLPPSKPKSPWVYVDARITEGRTMITLERSCLRCPKTSIAVERLVDGRWVKTRTETTTRREWLFSTRKTGASWRIRVGSTAYTPVSPISTY